MTVVTTHVIECGIAVLRLEFLLPREILDLLIYECNTETLRFLGYSHRPVTASQSPGFSVSRLDVGSAFHQRGGPGGHRGWSSRRVSLTLSQIVDIADRLQAFYDRRARSLR